jgi:type IV pilus assembly protein PilW
MKFKIRISHYGFTLTELLVAMGISGIVMVSTYSVYHSHQKSYVVQEQVVAMQQNLRAAMYFMEREIRMAGCDPTQSAAAGIATAEWNSIRVTSDIHDGVDNDGDGTVDEDDEVGNADGVIDPTNGNEDITYSLSDSDGDGYNDLERNGILIAENIDALNFVYLNAVGTPLDDDGDGNVIANIPNIRSIQITIVARTGRDDTGYTNTAAYANQQGTVILLAQNDSFRRRRLTAQLKCRNLGF